MAITGTEKETNKINKLVQDRQWQKKFQITSDTRNAKQKIAIHLNL